MEKTVLPYKSRRFIVNFLKPKYLHLLFVPKFRFWAPTANPRLYILIIYINFVIEHNNHMGFTDSGVQIPLLGSEGLFLPF
jgi:hypothetical protein